MTTQDDIVRVHGEHPDWTAKQIADHLQIERYHVYNTARAKNLTLAAAQLPVPTVPQSAAIAAAPTAPSDFIVYANTPADMAAAQAAMLEWCDGKMQVDAAELEQAKWNAAAAAEHGFSGEAWDRQVKILRQKLDFYEKVKLALRAGYYIVPPFPIDIFAIRTNAKTPRGGWTTQNWRTKHEQKEQLLPVGEGRYLSPDPIIHTTCFEEDDGKGGKKQVRYWRPEEFRDADFPFKLARAEVLGATRAAMAMKVFDRMGALPSHRAPDPIICGQILMPHRDRAPVTFFVSWWLDTKTM